MRDVTVWVLGAGFALAMVLWALDLTALGQRRRFNRALARIGGAPARPAEPDASARVVVPYPRAVPAAYLPDPEEHLLAVLTGLCQIGDDVARELDWRWPTRRR